MLPSDTLRDGALEIVRTLRAAGHEALWAGGCVRDLLLGRAPKDIDIATSATPEVVLPLFPRAYPVGAAFGVVRVLHAGHEYEIATFRADGAYLDGRRPVGVRWASAEEDVARRDFTINGLLQDPLTGAIFDHVGGERDLRAGVIRAIGDAAARFGEDHLRVLRALRFAARFGFRIEDATWEAVRAFAPRVASVSVERIRDELDKLLTEGGAARGLGLLVESGVGPVVLPGLDLTHPARHFQGLGRCEPALGWGILAAGLPEGEVASFLDGLRHARAFGRLVADAVGVARAVIPYGQHSLSARKRLLRRPGAAIGLSLTAALGHDPAAARAELATWDAAALSPPPLVTGHDLAAAGLRQGPRFRDALLAVETAQLEGTVTTREEALALALRVHGPDEPGAEPDERPG
jgi:poly(A) polymerase